MKYAKSNFFAAREGDDADDTRRELRRWTDEIANTRIHGTTHRRPIDLFADERAALLAIPDRDFELLTWHQGRVHLDTHVAFDTRLYSVPWPLIGQLVWVRATATAVVIFAGDQRVATHDRRGKTVRSTCEEHLPEKRAPWRHRDRAYWENRADQIAPEVGAYVREVLDSDDVLSMVRVVQSMVAHLEKFPVERAVAACTRARHFGSYQYVTIKNILHRGLDLVPLIPKPTSGVLAAPRFARTISELFHRHEVTHEHH